MTHDNPNFLINLYESKISTKETSEYQWHNDLQVIYIKKGSIHYTINGYPNLASEGELIFINPKQVYYYSLKSDSVELVTFSFNYNLLMTQIIDTVTEDIIVPLDTSKLIFHNVVDDLDIKTLFNKICKTLLNKDKWYELKIKSLLYELIQILLDKGLYYENKAYKRAKEMDSNDITRYILEYIHKAYNEDINLDKISNHIKVSKYHMCRIFKNKTSLTINHYLLNYRLTQAKKLLEETSKNVNTISYEVGFNNPSYFIQKFKAMYGVTPNKYN